MSRCRGGLAADRAEEGDRLRSARRRPTRRARHRGASGREDGAGDGDRRRPEARRGADDPGSDGVCRSRTRQGGRNGPLRGAYARADQQLGNRGGGALSCACRISAGFRRRNRGRCAVARSRPARIRVGVPDVRHLRTRGTHAATIHRRSDPRWTHRRGYNRGWRMRARCCCWSASPSTSAQSQSSVACWPGRPLRYSRHASPRCCVDRQLATVAVTAASS